MKVYVQWSLADPQDWQLVDVSTAAKWRNLAKKAEPVGGETIDNTAGWVYAVNVQGVLFYGHDHYSATIVAGALQVTSWVDDPVVYPDPEDWYAHVWTFRDPASDARYGGQVNTRQTLIIYGGANARAKWEGKATSGGPVIVLPFGSFAKPAANMTRHGIWLPDALSTAHWQRQTRHGWDEWVP